MCLIFLPGKQCNNNLIKIKKYSIVLVTFYTKVKFKYVNHLFFCSEVLIRLKPRHSSVKKKFVSSQHLART